MSSWSGLQCKQCGVVLQDSEADSHVCSKSTFQRENRYLVIKRKDLACLGKFEREMLDKICTYIKKYRTEISGRKPLECVVVESDWPEYEPTWKAIEDRMTSSHG